MGVDASLSNPDILLLNLRLVVSYSQKKKLIKQLNFQQYLMKEAKLTSLLR